MHNLIDSNEYIKSAEDFASLKALLEIFEENIKPDGVRNRAYLKLISLCARESETKIW